MGLVLCTNIDACAQPVEQKTTPLHAIQGIVQAFQKHPIVIIGEKPLAAAGRRFLYPFGP